MKAKIKRNRNRFTGHYAIGCTLIAEGGYWIGPGLGHFRCAAEARAWGIVNGYTVA